MGLHYWSFVYRLGARLAALQQRARDQNLTITVQLVPLTNTTTSTAATASTALAKLNSLAAVLSSVVDATPCPPVSASGGESGAAAAQGHARVFLQQNGSRKLVCTLTFAQPSLLSVQFAEPALHDGRAQRVRLTTKPLAVDLDTLDRLLVQQLRL